MNAAIDVVPLWLFFPLAAAMGMLTVEGGYRFGIWRHEHVMQENDSTVAAISASVLGLLGIMLAFTFSLAASRFEAHRQGVLEESNAIGTPSAGAVVARAGAGGSGGPASGIHGDSRAGRTDSTSRR